MASKLISIIIPVFNAVDSLDSLFHSLVNNQFTTITSDKREIIAINDESTDDSLAKLKDWQAKYPENIIILNQPKSGVSIARNNGLDAANGEWIYFIDADDFLAPKSLDFLLDTAIKHNVDAIKFGYKHITNSEIANFINRPISFDAKSFTTTGIEYINLTEGLIKHITLHPFPAGIWGTILKRNAIGDTRFKQHLIMGQDVIFSWEILLKNPQIFAVDLPLYYYVKVDSSTTNNTDPNHIYKMMFGRIQNVNLLLELCNKNKLLFTPETISSIENLAMFLQFAALIDGITTKASLSDFWQAWRKYKAYGLKVEPGKPRFKYYYRPVNYTLRHKIRRLIVALVMPTAMGLIDFVRGRGLWTLKNPQYID